MNTVRSYILENKLKNNSGFTLIELLIIIAIVGVISGIAVMESKEMYNSYQIRGLARQVYSDMQYARLVAIKQGQESVIDWEKDASGDIYYVSKWKDPAKIWPRAGDPIYLTGVKSSYKTIKACHPTSPASELTDIEFNPNGTSSIAGGIKLSKGGRVYKIYVSSAGTGNVRILNRVTLLDEDPDNADECP